MQRRHEYLLGQETKMSTRTNTTHFRLSLFTFLSVVYLVALVGTANAQLTNFNVGFENPPYTLGPIGNGPFELQDHWSGSASQYVTNSLAHSGTQSLFTTAGDPQGGFVSKNLDAGGSYGGGTDWYMETFVFVVPGTSANLATFAPGTSLGTSFSVSIHGDGAIDFFSGGASTQRTGSVNFLNQWLRVLVVHFVADNADLHMSVDGIGANESFTGSYGTVSPPSIISVNGPTAYWDDIRAVSGALPIPEPSTAILVGLGIATLGYRLRQVQAERRGYGLQFGRWVWAVGRRHPAARKPSALRTG